MQPVQPVQPTQEAFQLATRLAHLLGVRYGHVTFKVFDGTVRQIEPTPVFKDGATPPVESRGPHD